jgi:hypothetical protein
MPIKLNHYWTIIYDKKNDYDKFIIKKFIPKINQLGMHTVAGWSVLVGAYNEIILESVSNDLYPEGRVARCNLKPNSIGGLPVFA